MSRLEPHEERLRVAQLIESTDAEGPGRRFAIWLQGCPLHCPGCCNPEMLKTGGGDWWSVSDLAARVLSVAGIEGITLLGGEPFAQSVAAARLAEAMQRQGLGVMVFSGYTLEELRQRQDAGVDALLAACDLLVDGRYVRDLPDRARRWIGSRNQRMHFLSARYQADDPCFSSRNSIEIRLRDGRLDVNGWPDAARELLKARRG